MPKSFDAPPPPNDRGPDGPQSPDGFDGPGTSFFDADLTSDEIRDLATDAAMVIMAEDVAALYNHSRENRDMASREIEEGNPLDEVDERTDLTIQAFNDRTAVVEAAFQTADEADVDKENGMSGFNLTAKVFERVGATAQDTLFDPNLDSEILEALREVEVVDLDEPPFDLDPPGLGPIPPGVEDAVGIIEELHGIIVDDPSQWPREQYEDDEGPLTREVHPPSGPPPYTAPPDRLEPPQL